MFDFSCVTYNQHDIILNAVLNKDLSIYIYAFINTLRKAIDESRFVQKDQSQAWLCSTLHCCSRPRIKENRSIEIRKLLPNDAGEGRRKTGLGAMGKSIRPLVLAPLFTARRTIGIAQRGPTEDELWKGGRILSL